MVVFTRKQKAEPDLKHLINVIMNQHDGSPITQALDNLGVVDTFNMISLERQQIKTMSYDDNGTTMAVNAATRNKVTIFIPKYLVPSRYSNWKALKASSTASRSLAWQATMLLDSSRN